MTSYPKLREVRKRCRPSAVVVYTVLCDRINDGDRTLSIAEISRDAACGRTATRRALGSLVMLGFVSKLDGRGVKARYNLN